MNALRRLVQREEWRIWDIDKNILERSKNSVGRILFELFFSIFKNYFIIHIWASLWVYSIKIKSEHIESISMEYYECDYSKDASTASLNNLFVHLT